MNLIKFEDFSFKYRGQEQDFTLKNIDLKIDSGKFVLLSGVTGSGKTSLVRAMNGLIPQFYQGQMKGNVFVKDKNTRSVPTSQLAKNVGLVFQNPENQLIAMNVEREIAFGPENLGIEWGEINSRVNECLKITNIEHLRTKAPFELSGGEQQRVAIASILSLQPDIVILDEPTSLLDPLGAIKILNLLKQLVIEKTISTVIVIEHRLDLILPLTNEIILIKNGQILEHGPTQSVVNGENFMQLGLNIPKCISIFNQLKKNKIFEGNLPISIEETIEIIKSIKKIKT